jgi:hypothetical protein
MPNNDTDLLLCKTVSYSQHDQPLRSKKQSHRHPLVRYYGEQKEEDDMDGSGAGSDCPCSRQLQCETYQRGGSPLALNDLFLL